VGNGGTTLLDITPHGTAKPLHGDADNWQEIFDWDFVDVALSPDGEELYVLTEDAVWLVRAPWGSQPGTRVLTGLRNQSPPFGIKCVQPG
jgi:hypothetical protein